MPFEELHHTADWCIYVWSDSLIGLFTDSAIGMIALTGVRLVEKPRVEHMFIATAPDAESLLVSFLSELTYYIEQQRQAFDQFDMSLDLVDNQQYQLSVSLHGAPILSIEKVIKAVTYHNLQIRETARGYEVEIVFDV
jgi:SHS2 domain-containing protein